MLPSLLLALASAAAAQNFDVTTGKAELASHRGAEAVCRNAGTPQEECTCPRGQAGPRKLRIHPYSYARLEFVDDRITDAVVAFGRANVLIRRTANGSFGLLQSPVRAKGGKDPENAAPNWKIDAMDELCAVAIDGLKNDPPKPGSLPIFFVKLGEGFKKSVFTHANGVTYGEGLLARCESVGVAIPDDKIRKALADVLVVVDAEPEQAHKHVVAHEIGHAVGRKSGAAKRHFDDIRDRAVENIMVTERSLEREQMKLNGFQVRAVCSSPYLSDEL